MKKTPFLKYFAAFSAFLIIITSQVLSQYSNEKLVTAIPQGNNMGDVYSFKHDIKTGAWVYNSYDTVTKMSTLITPKGSSKEYNNIVQYFALFDADGNSYTIVSEYANDTLSNYYVLKNTEPITQAYAYISEGWSMRDGILYFSATQGGKSYFNSYDTRTGTLSQSRPYDEVRLAYIPEGYYEGEPLGEVGFTKSGAPYYVAVDNDEAFFVIGGVEQKHYSDISWYDTKTDKDGNLIYIAKDKGKLYSERGNTFVVQGTNEYKKFDWVYGPILLDASNNPIYAGQDSAGEYIYRTTVMRGGDVIKTYDGTVYSYMFAPNGKLAYVVSPNDPSGANAGGNFLVVDGKDSKKYNSVGMLKFTNGSVPLYSITDKKNKTVIIEGTEEASPKYDYFPDFGYLADGSMFWIGTTYGNYDAKKPDKNYVMVQEEKLGPYDFVYTSDWKTNTIILSDKKGNFAFVAGRNTDYDNYIYKYNVVSNNWKSDDFDAINETKLAGGKVFFFGGKQSNRGQYTYDYRLYVNNKPVGSQYSSITDVKVDASGKMTFLGARDNSIYSVEIK